MSLAPTLNYTHLRLRYVDEHGRDLQVEGPTRFVINQPMTLASGDPSVIPFKEYVRTIIVMGKEKD
jgi:hypothetical protein